MEISYEDDADGIRRITLTGKMNFIGVDKIGADLARLSTPQNGRILIDMWGVTMISSIAIRHIFDNARKLAGRDGRMVIYRPVPNVEEVLTVTGVDKMVPIHHSEATAVTALTHGD